MSQHSLIRSIGLLFCLIVFSFELSAEDREGAFSITPQVGGYLFEGDQNLEHGFTLGLGAGYNFTQNWGAEFLFNYLNTEFKSAPVDVNGYLYRFDVLYHFMPEKKTVPYRPWRDHARSGRW
jgi:OOP family OmpA-OmpF porin